MMSVRSSLIQYGTAIAWWNYWLSIMMLRFEIQEASSVEYQWCGHHWWYALLAEHHDGDLSWNHCWLTLVISIVMDVRNPKGSGFYITGRVGTTMVLIVRFYVAHTLRTMRARIHEVGNGARSLSSVWGSTVGTGSTYVVENNVG